MLSRAVCHEYAIETLIKRADFLAIQGEGQKWVSPALILQTKTSHTPGFRLGFTVSKRTSKSAVTRNRIKRRLRAAAAAVMPGFVLSGRDYVLVGRPAALEKSFDDLCRDLKWCLKRLECLADAPSAD